MSVRRWSICNTTSSASVNGSVWTYQAHTAASVRVDTHGIQTDSSAKVSWYCIPGWSSKTECPEIIWKNIGVFCLLCFFLVRYQWMRAEEWRLLSHLHEPQRWLQVRLSWKLPCLTSQQEEVSAGVTVTNHYISTYSIYIQYISLLINPPGHTNVRYNVQYVKLIFWSLLYIKLKIEINIIILI